jgi:hypothetical protein
MLAGVSSAATRALPPEQHCFRKGALGGPSDSFSAAEIRLRNGKTPGLRIQSERLGLEF